MKEDSLTSMYSRKSLEALEQTLRLHKSLVWIDPATNQVAIKRITPVQESDQRDHSQTLNT